MSKRRSLLTSNTRALLTRRIEELREQAERLRQEAERSSKHLPYNFPHARTIEKEANKLEEALAVLDSRLMINWIAIALRTDSSVGVVMASS